MAGADLRLAEKQRGVVPAAIEHIDDRVGDTRHLGFVLAEAVDDAGQVGQQPCPIDLVVIDGQAEIVALLLKNVKQPMRQLDIAVSRALGVAQGLDECVVADPVQLSGDGFEADVGHVNPLKLKSKRCDEFSNGLGSAAGASSVVAGPQSVGRAKAGIVAVRLP